ncbi:MAG TPA: DUF1015 family protein [Xanthobacteraceae bacterium]|nr:DUF1015 family protein [Xanthobacteraceae bacterium]
MTLIRPFRALRPPPGRAAEVLAPPYDVLSSAEARERASGKPWSFLHVSKPEIDLDPAIDPYDRAAYAKAADNLERMIRAGVLVRDEKPAYYVYRLTWRGRTQTGLAALAALADYKTNRIRKHEHTTPVKEDDRVRQIEAINAQTGPVMMGYPATPAIDALIVRAAGRAPDVDVTADDQVRHQLWVINDEATIAALTRAVDALPALYIADGHHRAAAAARVAEARRGGAASHFLAVLFPHHEMTILDYNRLLRDLNGQSLDELLAQLRKRFSVAASDQLVRPAAGGEFGMYVAGRWYRLTIKPDLVPANDPIGRLPITLLTKNVIEPLFGITDPRADKRIDFVGGARGLAELERRVSSGEMAAAFALYPTQMTDLMAVADAGGIMPPKSTWFEPKLADGMVSHVLD